MKLHEMPKNIAIWSCARRMASYSWCQGFSKASSIDFLGNEDLKNSYKKREARYSRAKDRVEKILVKLILDSK